MLELPKEKRPTEFMFWMGSPEELEKWFDKVFDRKKEPDSYIEIDESEFM